MHHNNAYYLRAITAEKELAIALDKGRQLYQDNRRLTRDHIYALRVIEGMGDTLSTRRHQNASAIGRLMGAVEMRPEALAALLLGIRTALAGVPMPSSEPEDAPEPTSPPSEHASAQNLRPEPLRVIRGGRDE